MTTAAQLDIVIRAQDQASRQLRQVQTSLGGLDKATTAFGIGSVATYASVAGGLAAVGIAAHAGWDEMQQAAKVSAQTDAVLASMGTAAGVTADHVDDLAGRMMNLSGVDDEVAQSAENILLGFGNIRNSRADKVFDDATLAAANLSARLGVDMVDAATTVGKALESPINATKALRGVNIILTQSEQDAIRAMVKVGDTAGAQRVILDKLNESVGGAAEAYGETLPGQVDIAQAKLENLAGEIMTDLVIGLGVMVDWLGKAKDGVVDLVNAADLFGWFDDTGQAAEDAGTGLDWYNQQLAKTQGAAEKLKAVDMGRGLYGPTDPKAMFGPTLETLDAVRQKADDAKRALYEATHQEAVEAAAPINAKIAEANRQLALIQQHSIAGTLTPEMKELRDYYEGFYLPTLESQRDIIYSTEDAINANRAATDAQSGSMNRAAEHAQNLSGELAGVREDAKGLGRALGDLPDGGTTLVDVGVKVLTAEEMKEKIRGPYNATAQFLRSLGFNFPDIGPPGVVTAERMKEKIRPVYNTTAKFLRSLGFNFPDIDPPRVSWTLEEEKAVIRPVYNATAQFLRSLGFNFQDIEPPKVPPAGPTNRQIDAVRTAVNTYIDGLPFIHPLRVGEPTVPPATYTNAQVNAVRTAVNTYIDGLPFIHPLTVGNTQTESAYTTQQTIEKLRERILYYLHLLTPLGGMTITSPPILAQLMPGLNAGAGMTPGGAGGAVTVGGGLTIVLAGTNLATPEGQTYVANQIYSKLKERMRQG